MILKSALFLPWLAVALSAASITHDSAQQTWSLQSGPVEYRLQQQDGAVRVAYFGPKGKPAWNSARYDIGGMVEDQPLLPAELLLTSQEAGGKEERPELRLTYRHKRLPLEIDAVYTACGSTGVFTRQLTYRNTGDRPLAIAAAPSLSWRLPPGEYSIDYLYGRWGEERQLRTERLAPGGRRSFVNRSGRSSEGASPWMSLRNETLGVRYAAQLAYSGNWEMVYEREADRRVPQWSDYDLRAELGLRLDFGGTAPLAPGKSLALPLVAFTASAADLDDVANQLHRFQYQYVIARTPTNEPLLMTFNPWQAVMRRPTAATVKQYADEAAALGLEAVVIDAGWFSSQVNPVYGDWETDRRAFPKGLRDVADHVHAKGMKFGVWLEPECAGSDSEVFKQHPDWVLRYNGIPRRGSRNRLYLNFAIPEVRQRVRAVIDRLVNEDAVDWLKLDYNVDLGDAFDPTGPAHSGTVLYEHLRNYFGMLDDVRRDHPNLVLENCSSGGLRFDLAIIGHTHTTWLSDVVEPHKSVQLAYGGTIEFTPGICNHWMVGDTERGGVNLDGAPGWWDFMFRIAMNGQFGVSSQLLEWSPALKERAKANIALYKRLRPLISGADVYHLTPPPATGKDPRGWMALQYTAADGKSSAVLAFRLGHSEPTQTLHLRGLDPRGNYAVSIDGAPHGTASGRELGERGLVLNLDDEWRSAVVELAAAR